MQISELIELVKEAEKEVHGTILIISADAQKEACRLVNQSTSLIPCRLTPDLLKHLTPIDGALILSPESICYSIGTILDGLATDKGDSTRGARYNSAVRYIEASKTPCIAFIVSEDGGVTIHPDLPPIILKSEIEMAINKLKEFSHSISLDKIKNYGDVLENLEKIHFHLSEEDSSQINKLVARIEKEIDLQDPGRIKIRRKCFKSNPKIIEKIHYWE